MIREKKKSLKKLIYGHGGKEIFTYYFYVLYRMFRWMYQCTAATIVANQK